jgi:crotonobetainyl-CoA:carnitine CoA-transferase CaiB-like acyl-CoA transferase
VRLALRADVIVESFRNGVMERLGNDHPLIAPSGAVRTSDSALVLTVLDHQWPKFCAALGLHELPEDVCFKTSETRQRNRKALRAILEPIFLSASTDEWLNKLRHMGVLCAPIHDHPALVKDPQVVHNEMFGIVYGSAGQGFPMIRNPVRISDTVPHVQPPPDLGQHTVHVLQSELGLTLT